MLSHSRRYASLCRAGREQATVIAAGVIALASLCCAEGSPIICHDGGELQSSLLLIPVRAWSDGSPAPPPLAKHTPDE